MRLTEARQGVRMLKFVDVFGRWEASKLRPIGSGRVAGRGGSGRSGVGAAATTREARPTCWTLGLARPRASACRSIDARSRASVSDALRWLPRRDISTSTWSATTSSPGATAGRRFSCKAGTCCRKRCVAARTVPEAAASPVAWHDVAPGCPRHAWLAEGPPLDLVRDDGRRDERDLLSAFLIEEEGAASTFRGLSKYSAARSGAEPLYRSRKSLLSHRRSRWQGGSAASRRRSDVLWRIWGSSTSRLTLHLRHAADRSVCSTLYRIGCQKNWCWRAS